jgi:hypothetical protein
MTQSRSISRMRRSRAHSSRDRAPAPKVEIAGGVFQVREDEPRAADRGGAASDTVKGSAI